MAKKRLTGQTVYILNNEGELGDAFTKREVEQGVSNGTLIGGEVFLKAKVMSKFALDVIVPEKKLLYKLSKTK